MVHFKSMGMVLVAWSSVLFTGCSSLHVEVRPGFDWAAVSSVTAQEPQPDRWNLGPVMRHELR